MGVVRSTRVSTVHCRPSSELLHLAARTKGGDVPVCSAAVVLPSSSCARAAGSRLPGRLGATRPASTPSTYALNAVGLEAAARLPPYSHRQLTLEQHLMRALGDHQPQGAVAGAGQRRGGSAINSTWHPVLSPPGSGIAVSAPASTSMGGRSTAGVASSSRRGLEAHVGAQAGRSSSRCSASAAPRAAAPTGPALGWGPAPAQRDSNTASPAEPPKPPADFRRRLRAPSPEPPPADQAHTAAAAPARPLARRPAPGSPLGWSATGAAPGCAPQGPSR